MALNIICQCSYCHIKWTSSLSFHWTSTKLHQILSMKFLHALPEPCYHSKTVSTMLLSHDSSTHVHRGLDVICTYIQMYKGVLGCIVGLFLGGGWARIEMGPRPTKIFLVRFAIMGAHWVGSLNRSMQLGLIIGAGLLLLSITYGVRWQVC